MIRYFTPLCVACVFTALNQHAQAEGEKELATYTKLHYSVVRADGKVVVVPITGPKATSRPLWLWDPVTDKRTKILPKGVPEADIVYAMPSPDGKTFLARPRSENGKFTTLILFDVETGKELGSATGEGNLQPDPFLVALSPDGMRVACRRSNNMDGIILLLDMYLGESKAVVQMREPWMPVFSADGKYLAAATGGRLGIVDAITVWDAATWRVANEFRVETENVDLFAISPDVKNLVTIAETMNEKEWKLRMWSLATDKQVWNLSRAQESRKKPNPFAGLAFGKKGEIVAVGTPGAVLILDTATGKELGSVKLSIAGKLSSSGEDKPVTPTPSHLSLSPDGKLLAVTLYDPLFITKVYDISALKK